MLNITNWDLAQVFFVQIIKSSHTYTIDNICEYAEMKCYNIHINKHKINTKMYIQKHR